MISQFWFNTRTNKNHYLVRVVARLQNVDSSMGCGADRNSIWQLSIDLTLILHSSCHHYCQALCFKFFPGMLHTTIVIRLTFQIVPEQATHTNVTAFAMSSHPCFKLYLRRLQATVSAMFLLLPKPAHKSELHPALPPQAAF